MKGKIIGTCGHKLSTKWFASDKGAICIKDTNKEGKGCLSYIVVCAKCLKWYQEEGLIVGR